ncbi:MAG: hypothetical protein FVQ81_16600 [Candidatus Glassbacteria bacterium]|nr:hypothetical protein [Candidatus Glassbacteria bacterium]
MKYLTVIVVSILALATAGPLSALELPLHPRLYLSVEGAEHVLSLAQVRSRARSPRFRQTLARAGASSNPSERAFVYLVSGDTSGLAVVRAALERNVSSYTQLMDRALAFDWAYGGLSDAERKKYAAGLIESARAVGRRYRIPTVYHNMCRGRNMGQGLAMLAAWEDAPGAAGYEGLVTRELGEFLELTGDGKQLDDMAGRAGWGGGWPEGYDYDRHGSLYALELLLAWRSCGLGDHLSGSTFWRDKIPYLVYGTGPDGSFVVGYEDNDWPFPMPHERKLMTFLEGEFDSGLASWWIDTWADTLNAPAYWDILFSDPQVRNVPPDKLPSSHLVPGVGLVLMRSSWERDATFVHFHCGPWYTYHQHAAQGSFTAWRGRDLVVEPGVYNGEVDEHYVNWRIRTISHNCITVMDRNEVFLGPEAVRSPANDGGQLIQNWTHKPATVAEWRAQRKLRDTGRIISFLTDPSHDFVEGDAAGGYNPVKVLSWRRQMVFVKPDWLVIRDMIESGRPHFAKTLYLHTPEKLVMDGNTARTEPSAGNPLTVWSLLPPQADLSVGGGPGGTFTYGGNDWTGPEQYNTQYGTAWRLTVARDGERLTEFLTVLNLAGDNPGTGAELLESGGERTAVALEGGRYQVAFERGAGGRYSLIGEGITYSICGTVASDGYPSGGQAVRLSGAGSRSARTDRHGNYAFDNLLPGVYAVTLEGTARSRDVIIEAGSLGEVNFD